MHEFVNSKMCERLPVSHVPGGSGNAFAKMQSELSGEKVGDREAVYLAVKGKIGHLSLTVI